MLLPDGTELMHFGEPYDPVKAHEYYLKRRKLHPRQKGSIEPTGSSRQPHETFTVKTSTGKTVRLTAQQLAEQRAYANHRVALIKDKLFVLKDELRKRLEAAKKREEAAKKPPSYAERAKAIREAKAYRQKHKQALATKRKEAASKSKTAKSKTPKAKTETVASLKKEIVQTRDSLKSAVAKQRELATAKKNG